MTRSDQLGFDALLTDADTVNERRRFERDTIHMPTTIEEACQKSPLFSATLKEFEVSFLCFVAFCR